MPWSSANFEGLFKDQRREALQIASQMPNAFLAGLHDVLLVATAIAFAGAVVSSLLIRSGDLDVTALSATPPEVDHSPENGEPAVVG